ncbi:MAG: hypothetical protein CMC76_12090 [Flavobacteriaceae bacterium]|nr:hypothetical protein [Flavobacteriaceae bacterium]
MNPQSKIKNNTSTLLMLDVARILVGNNLKKVSNQITNIGFNNKIYNVSISVSVEEVTKP